MFILNFLCDTNKNIEQLSDLIFAIVPYSLIPPSQLYIDKVPQSEA